MDLSLRILQPKCHLVNGKGEVASEEIDQKVEFYFNLMLESIEELKLSGKAFENKFSLKGKSLLKLSLLTCFQIFTFQIVLGVIWYN